MEYHSKNRRTHQRNKGLRSLSALTQTLIAPAMKNRVKILARLITEWQDIAGDAYRFTDPVDIQFPPNRRNDATLVLSVSAGTGPIVQMMSPQIIDRVNAMAGFGMVTKIRLVQNMRPHKQTEGADFPESSSDTEQSDIMADDSLTRYQLEQQTQHIQNPRLRAALMRLGHQIHKNS